MNRCPLNLLSFGLIILSFLKAPLLAQGTVFPIPHWEHKAPEELGLKGGPLAELGDRLGGRGCVIKDGYVVHEWGDQSDRSDWLSSAKPVLSTLLFFAIEEGKAKGVDQKIADFGWDLLPKDQSLTFRHLGSMTSGYARPEEPGKAWAYNDFAIQLYQKTLFDKVFGGDPKTEAEAPNRLGALGLEDGLAFREGNRRMSSSVRDFARIAWFWMNRGKWGEKQVLPARYFEDFMKPQTAPDLPHTGKAETNDYLGIGSYGGGSDHFTEFGAGIYGFNWWFNAKGRLHPDALTWPDAPEDAVMSIGAGGNCAALIPSRNLLVVCAKGNWGKLEAGTQETRMNEHYRMMLKALGETGKAVLLEEDFSGFGSGHLMEVVGAHMEYHYLPESAPIQGWSISNFSSDPYSQRAWCVQRDEARSEMCQTFANNQKHWHPMLVYGDETWRDYTLEVAFLPESDKARSGVVFRYRNDRCYYFFGIQGEVLQLKRVQHETAFHIPDEKVLAEMPFTWTQGEPLRARVQVEGNRITASLEGKATLEAEDDTFPEGKIALCSDVPTRFRSVRVTVTAEEERRVAKAVRDRQHAWEQLQAGNPKMQVWKKLRFKGVLNGKIKTGDFGADRNLRFGDLDGDGDLDLLVGQIKHHGPKDRNSELACMTAMTFDGDILWQSGKPDQWKSHLSNDVAFQIHDLDRDGKNEVVYCRDFELNIAEGATGKVLKKIPMPDTPPDTREPYNTFPKILGDALFFCDLSGKGYPSDILIKNRYQYVWTYTKDLEPLWMAECNTGHYPYAYDMDGDGKEEIAIGYSLFDDNGTQLWSFDKQVQDHADGVAIVRFDGPESEPIYLSASSDEGMFFAHMKGNKLKHHYLGHVQNPAVLNLRDDLPGLETLTVNFWGNQGIFHYYDHEGNLFFDFEPCSHGSMCLPTNWTGKSEEFFILSPNADHGGLFDGWGRKVAVFPADGHPEMCYAVMDLVGDCRDEIVVWDPFELWVYTQDDNPKEGQLYKPQRNPLWNYSNYQTTVSLPGWSGQENTKTAN